MACEPSVSRGYTSTSAEKTYEGMPTAMAKQARMVSPFPYPSALYIAGANNGKPKPARERKNVTAARATPRRYQVLSRRSTG